MQITDDHSGECRWQPTFIKPSPSHRRRGDDVRAVQSALGSWSVLPRTGGPNRMGDGVPAYRGAGHTSRRAASQVGRMTIRQFTGEKARREPARSV